SALINADGSAPVFENDGTFIQSAGVTDSSRMYAVFDQSTSGSVDVRGGTLQFSGNSTFAGTVEATTGGAVVMTTAPTNLSGAVLTGAAWMVAANSALSLGGPITTDAATIVLDGTATSFDSLSTLSQIAAGSSLEILEGGSFTTAGDLDNAGTIDLAAGTLN